MSFVHCLIALLCLGASLANDALATEPGVLIAEGLAAFHRGDYPAARQAFEQAVVLDPTDADSAYYLGITQGRLGDFSGAVDALRTALRRRSPFPRASYELGIALYNVRRYDEAVVRLEDGRSAADSEGAVEHYLGLAELGRGDTDAAIVHCGIAAAGSPAYEEAGHYCIGVAHTQESRWASAAREFDTVIQHASPTSTVADAAQRFVNHYHYDVSGFAAFEYETNVARLPVDDAIQPLEGQRLRRPTRGDGSAVLGVSGGYRWGSDRLEVVGGYDFYQSLHIRRTDLDVQDHRPRLQLLTNIPYARLGVDLLYDYFRFGERSYLQQFTVWPLLRIPERRFGSTELRYRFLFRDYLQADLGESKTALDRRAKENNAWEIRQLVYLDSPSRYLSVGYRFDRDGRIGGVRPVLQKGITDDRIAYDGHQGDVFVGWEFDRLTTGLIGYVYRHEEYDRTSRVARQLRARHDDNHRLLVTLRRALTNYAYVNATYSYVQNDSTFRGGRFGRDFIPNAEYGDHIWSIGIELRY